MQFSHNTTGNQIHLGIITVNSKFADNHTVIKIETGGIGMDYTIKRELMQIYGEIERQFGMLNKPVKSISAKLTNITGDFEKIISEKCATLTESQKYSIAQKMGVHRLS
jgi:hypothetical protein